uniref:Uncharacterized protein n=1 Tax=Chenopodium quinoa TaxID=63459 RepID=A0A803MKX3_CHEQI
MVMILVQKQVQFSKTGYGVSCVVIMLLLILPLFLVFREELYASSKTKLEMNTNTPGMTLSELKVMPSNDKSPSTNQPNDNNTNGSHREVEHTEVS